MHSIASVDRHGLALCDVNYKVRGYEEAAGALPDSGVGELQRSLLLDGELDEMHAMHIANE